MPDRLVFDTIEYKGLTIKLRYDGGHFESPREWSPLGTFITWERRRQSPDQNPFDSPDDFRAHAEYEEFPVLLNVYVYEHGGIKYSTTPFRSRWDSGQVGFIYMDRETLERYGQGKEKAEEVLRSEVAMYSAWANGEVYGFTIEDDEGDMIESCFGFIGDSGRKQMEEEAKAIADHHVKRMEENERQLEEFYRTVWAD